MRVIVTGGTGNVGTAVVDALGRADAVTEVIVAARRPPAARALPAKARYHAADVGADDLSSLMRGADAVVHLAWLFQPTHDPLMTWRVNAVGSVRTFEAAAAAGVGALVYASSVGAYSPGPGRTVDESWPTHSTPTAAYGREKAYVERALDVVEARHPAMRIVRMRPGFIFQRASGTEQRRLFAGPLVPRPLLRRGRLPVLPLPVGLRFQALHTSDAARAYAAAVVGDARGAFNLAADPVIDGPVLAEIVGARLVEVPRSLVRGAVATGWHLRAVPADPRLLDLVLGLPLLDTTRARTELGWRPAMGGDVALREALDGMADGAGGDTEPLAPDAPARRVEEVATGVGGRDI
jgi:UDP-glucose 4-epimerase